MSRDLSFAGQQPDVERTRVNHGKYGGARMYARIYCIYHACMPAPSSSIMPGFCGRDNGHKAFVVFAQLPIAFYHPSGRVTRDDTRHSPLAPWYGQQTPYYSTGTGGCVVRSVSSSSLSACFTGIFRGHECPSNMHK